MSLSSRTIAMLARPFEGGDGPSHAVIEVVWQQADAREYLGEGNKMSRVLVGLRSLRSGRRAGAEGPALPADQDKLREVVAELATLLMAKDLVDVDQLHNALERDGFAVLEGEVAPGPSSDEPVDRLAKYVETLFGERSEFKVAERHYLQATRAFSRQDWEAANAQFRSSFDATYDVLARARGAPASRKGGAARKWLQHEGLLEKDAADLVRAFAAFAGGAGSHAGISAAADAALRRHFATALIAFALAKRG